MTERINELKDGKWVFDKKIKDDVPFKIFITGCPDEKTMCQWFVDEGLIGIAELAVISRRKFDGPEKLTWDELKVKLTTKATRGLSPEQKKLLELQKTLGLTADQMARMIEEYKK